MELKSKEQWRGSLEGTLESSLQATPTRAIRLVSVEEYAQALCSLESVITEKQRNMLVAHAMAPERALTMTELAALVGFPNYSAANLQYGLLAGKLADALGIQRPVFLVYVIASFDDDPDTLHSRAHMYPELFAALQQLGWVATQNATQALIASGSVSTDVALLATPTAAGDMLSLQQVITTLESHGFTRPEQSGLKVVRLEHSVLSAPLFVKQSSSIHARLQAPLVLHPSYEEQLVGWLSIPGIERGHARYYHNSNLRGFPKRRKGGATDIAYGVDLGFQHIAALEQFLASLIGFAPISAEQASNHAGCEVPDPFDLQGLTLTDTERDALIKVRIGQSGYRDALLEYWGGCAITDCTVPALLRASHIKPWRVASPFERLDPYNGLLLTPNLDLAFDQGLISFDDHGQILLGEDLDPDSARALNITPELRLRQIEPRHCGYLAWHREHLFRN